MRHHTSHTLGRPQKLYVICAALFITALVVAEATAGKFFTAFDLPFTLTIFGMRFDSVVMTTGVLAFPLTFIITDLINEYYGKAGIRFVTYLGMAAITMVYLLLQVAIQVPTAPNSPVPDEAFRLVFGTSGRIIIGSLTAYLLGQLADISLFHYLRRLTEGRFPWLRATGSTFGSQFVDTLIVLTVAFAGRLPYQDILAITLFNYGYKFAIAVLITPLIYLAHWLMDRYLGREREGQFVGSERTQNPVEMTRQMP